MTNSDREDHLLLLHAALDGELDALGALEAERALGSDPILAAEYARLEELRRAIRAHAPRETAPETLRARVIALTADEEAASPVVALKRPHVERPTWRAFAAAIAAMIVVTLGLQTLVSTSSAPDDAALAVVAGHMRAQISGQPVDVASSDHHTVKPWLAAKLPVDTFIANLAPDGFELLGGRIDIVAARPRRRSSISADNISCHLRSCVPLSATIRRRRVTRLWTAIRLSSGETTRAPMQRFPI